MISEKILHISILAILLSAVAVGAEKSDCVGGVCFATLDNKPVEAIEVKKEIKYVEEYDLDTNLDKSETIVLDGETITVFPKSSYVMNENEEVDLLVVFESLDDKILEKSDLKDSLYYCENDKHPEFNEFSDLYQCV